MSKRTLQSIAEQLRVTGYVDYREFLNDLYREIKAATSPYSYETFATDLGFSATNALRLVISRRRQLSEKSAQTIAKALDLRRENRKYFLAMVRHGNAKSPKLKAEAFQRMLAAKEESLLSHRERDRLAFLSEWYHWVILEMLRWEHGQSDPEWLASQLLRQVGADKVRRSLALLESLGLIAIDHDTKKLRPVEASPTLAMEDETAGQLALTRHHQTMLSLASQALTDLPTELREFNALTLNLSETSFKKLAGMIRAFCQEALTLESTEEDRTCVAQLNLNLFALTKTGKE